MTPQQLFDYANNFARRREAAGQGTVYPTFRQAAKRFGVKLDDIEQAVEEYQGEGYLGAVVAYGISGVGAAAIDTRGEYLVEAYS